MKLFSFAKGENKKYVLYRRSNEMEKSTTDRFLSELRTFTDMNYRTDIACVVEQFLFSFLPNISKCSAFMIKWLDWSWFNESLKEEVLFTSNFKIEGVLLRKISIRKKNVAIYWSWEPIQIFLVFHGRKTRIYRITFQRRWEDIEIKSFL